MYTNDNVYVALAFASEWMEYTYMGYTLVLKQILVFQYSLSLTNKYSFW